MPSQELYLEKKAGLDVFQVLKTYDTAFAKETFAGMDEAAIEHLSKSLSISEEFPSDEMPTSPADIPALQPHHHSGTQHLHRADPAVDLNTRQGPESVFQA